VNGGDEGKLMCFIYILIYENRTMKPLAIALSRAGRR
jgi:hypothetical protein